MFMPLWQCGGRSEAAGQQKGGSPQLAASRAAAMYHQLVHQHQQLLCNLLSAAPVGDGGDYNDDAERAMIALGLQARALLAEGAHAKGGEDANNNDSEQQQQQRIHRYGEAVRAMFLQRLSQPFRRCQTRCDEGDQHAQPSDAMQQCMPDLWRILTAAE